MLDKLQFDIACMRAASPLIKHTQIAYEYTYDLDNCELKTNRIEIGSRIVYRHIHILKSKHEMNIIVNGGRSTAKKSGRV